MLEAIKSQHKTPIEPSIYSLGDSAVILKFGDTISKEVLHKMQGFISCIKSNPLQGMIEYVPAYTTITIYYNPWVVSVKGKYNAFEKISVAIREILKEDTIAEKDENRHIEISVCYGNDFGPDLSFVAQHNHLDPEEVISLHTKAEYLVYMIGFAPGFPYLGGMDPKIAAPRKSTPRLAIPKGSVGIAGNQTGIYPIETPGGWQLIGRTPLPLFAPQEEAPTLLRAGDVVRFISISAEEFYEKINQSNEP